MTRKASDPNFQPLPVVPPSPPPSPKSEPDPPIFSSRLYAVFVAAIVFGTGAYLGLGGSSSVNAGAATSPSPSVAAAVQMAADTSIRDEFRPHLAVAIATVVPTQTAAPTDTPEPSVVEVTPRPTRQPDPEPAAEPAPASDGSFEAIICSKPWPCDQAIEVASCESGLDQNGRLDGNWASNGNNYGLFQINGVHADLWPDFYEDWMDPVKNTEWAYEIWSVSGWRPWSCQPY